MKQVILNNEKWTYKTIENDYIWIINPQVHQWDDNNTIIYTNHNFLWTIKRENWVLYDVVTETDTEGTEIVTETIVEFTEKI